MFHLVITACMLASFATNGAACKQITIAAYQRKEDCILEKPKMAREWLANNDGYRIEDIECRN